MKRVTFFAVALTSQHAFAAPDPDEHDAPVGPGPSVHSTGVASREPVRARPPLPERAIVLDGSLGGGSDGVHLGLTALYYTSWLEGGVAVTSRSGIFGHGSELLTALAGARLDPGRHARVELLAEGGASVFHGLGTDVFSTPLERHLVVLPYVGGRLGLSALIGRSSTFVLGAWLQGGREIGRRTVTVPVETCFLSCRVENERITVGGPSWALGLRIGGQIFLN